MTVVAVVAALLSAAAYAAGAALQQHAAAATAGRGGIALLVRLLRRPRWRAGILCVLVGAGLHLLALRWGPLVLVQPIGAVGVVLALPIGAALSARPVSRFELIAAAAVGVGLLGLLLSVRAVPGLPRLNGVDLPAAGVLVVAAVAACVVGGLLLAGGARAVVFAAGAGVCFGATSAVARGLVVQAGPEGLRAVALSAPAAAFAAAAAAGLVLAQTAYAAGTLGSVLATLTVVDPLVAVGLGHAFLGERVAVTAVGGLTAVACAGAVVVGTAVLAQRHPTADALVGR